MAVFLSSVLMIIEQIKPALSDIYKICWRLFHIVQLMFFANLHLE